MVWWLFLNFLLLILKIISVLSKRMIPTLPTLGNLLSFPYGLIFDSFGLCFSGIWKEDISSLEGHKPDSLLVSIWFIQILLFIFISYFPSLKETIKWVNISQYNWFLPSIQVLIYVFRCFLFSVYLWHLFWILLSND